MIVWSVFDRCSRCVWHLIWKKQLYSSAPVQCDQIGRFLKVLGNKISNNFLGYFEKTHSYVKTALATFWATFGNKLSYFLLQHLVTLLLLDVAFSVLYVVCSIH